MQLDNVVDILGFAYVESFLRSRYKAFYLLDAKNGFMIWLTFYKVFYLQQAFFRNFR